MKTCTLCKIEKDLDLFSFRSDKKDVKNSWCKDCNREYKRIKSIEYRKKRDKVLDVKISEQVCSKCKINKTREDFYKDNRTNSGLRYDCKDCCKIESKEYIDNNKELVSKRNSESYLKNLDYNLERTKRYRDENKEKISEYNKNYKKKRFENDENFRFTTTIRKNINSYLKGNKNKKTEEILGCSFLEFRKYIESKFENWMKWENYGKYNGEFSFGWDLDHIVPLSSANDIERLIELNHYNNFQPLCSKTNRYVKSNKLV